MYIFLVLHCLGCKYLYYRPTLSLCLLLSSVGSNFPCFFAFQRILQAEVLANFILDYLFKDICTVNMLGRQRLSPGTKGRFIYHLA